MDVMRTRWGVAGATLAMGAVLASPAHGQAAPPAASLAPEDPDFDRILANPDDPAINLKFAQDEAAAGRLLSAAAALERLLIGNPEWHAIRLFYATVLYRLDDRQSARREFALLRTKPLSPDQRAEVEQYIRLLDRRQSALRISGQASVGIAYDSNAQGSLSSSLDVGLGIYRPDDGLSFVGLASLDFSKPFGRTHGLFGSISALTKNDVSGPNQSYQRGDAAIGVYGTGARFSWRAGAVLHHTILFDDRYLTEAGGRIDLTHRVGAKTSVGGSIEVTRQDYAPQSLEVLLSASKPRSGTRVDGALSLTHRLTVHQTLSGQIGYEYKDANYDPFAYHGPYVYVAYLAQLGRGSYFSLAGTARRLDYRAADPVFTGAAVRQDTRSFARMALGAPLSAFTTSGVTGDIRERLRLEGAVSYSRQDTNSPYVDFDSIGGELRLIWRFGG